MTDHMRTPSPAVGHTPTPWEYRPYKHDDWGWIRGPAREGEEFGELVAKANCWATEEEKDAHRRAGTDPYEANAAFIVRAVNNHKALVKGLEDIAAIENQEFGGDWDEIEQARKIARAALSAAKGES